MFKGKNYNIAFLPAVYAGNDSDVLCQFTPADIITEGLNVVIVSDPENPTSKTYAPVNYFGMEGDGYIITFTMNNPVQAYAEDFDSIFIVDPS